MYAIRSYYGYGRNGPAAIGAKKVDKALVHYEPHNAHKEKRIDLQGKQGLERLDEIYPLHAAEHGHASSGDVDQIKKLIRPGDGLDHQGVGRERLGKARPLPPESLLDP